MKVLTATNFLGVLLLVGLSAIQWSRNRDLKLQDIDLEHTRQVQARKIEEQETAITGYKGDLDDRNLRLERCEADLKKQDADIRKLAAERDNLATNLAKTTADLDQAHKSLDEWIAATKARDEALKNLGDGAKKLATDRDEAIKKFNDLAVKYNTLVKEWNEKVGAK